MKIRLKNNHIRFRLSHHDNTLLGQGGNLTCVLTFPSASLTFSLSINEKLKTEFNLKKTTESICCHIHPFIYDELQTNKTRGINLEGLTLCQIEIDHRKDKD